MTLDGGACCAGTPTAAEKKSKNRDKGRMPSASQPRLLPMSNRIARRTTDSSGLALAPQLDLLDEDAYCPNSWQPFLIALCRIRVAHHPPALVP